MERISMNHTYRTLPEISISSLLREILIHVSLIISHLLEKKNQIMISTYLRDRGKGEKCAPLALVEYTQYEKFSKFFLKFYSCRNPMVLGKTSLKAVYRHLLL